MNVKPVAVTTKNPFPPLPTAKQPYQKQKKVNSALIGSIAGAALGPHVSGTVLAHVLTPDSFVKLAAGDKKTKLLYSVGLSVLSVGVAALGALIGKGVEKMVEKIKKKSEFIID